jgi:hypothetical protein
MRLAAVALEEPKLVGARLVVVHGSVSCPARRRVALAAQALELAVVGSNQPLVMAAALDVPGLQLAFVEPPEQGCGGHVERPRQFLDIDPIGIRDQGTEQTTDLEHWVPVTRAARQARDLQPEDDADMIEPDLAGQALKTGSTRGARTRAASVVVDDQHLRQRPAKLTGPRSQSALAARPFALMRDLLQGRLTHADDGETDVKTQVWIDICVYVLVAIVKKRLDIPASLYTMLQILSLTLFERAPLNPVLTRASDVDNRNHGDTDNNQSNLFASLNGHYC